MGEKLAVGPINKGQRTDREAFNIDNDSFPTLFNAYQWRGRVKRKRGTSLVGRLQRFLGTTDPITGNLTVTILPTPIASGIISVTVGTDLFTDPGGASPVTLISNRMGATATLDRTTGSLNITGSQKNTSVLYYPSLPVMGLEDLVLISTQFPGTLAFDTKYAYNITTTFPSTIYDVSFYKNPAADGTNLPGYVPKSTWTPTTWNGQNYQQFWSTNYQGAFWVTNGINVPFSITNVGMQYKFISGITIITAGNGVFGAGNVPAVADITINAHGLVQGDFVFINEVILTAITGISGINFQTGYVTSTDPQNPNLVRVTFPFAILGGTYAGGGIAQYLTNRSDVTKDCIRWYDGDPTGGTIPPTFTNGPGWVNFAPPISQSNFSIADLPAAQYYLVGARMIVPFKDRLLFIGPVVQTSADGSQVYLQDTVIYSQNGTPYYTASYKNNPDPTKDTPTSAGTTFHPILVPIGQTATSPAYFADSTGFGGFITAGVDQPILTVAPNEDVLIMGFSGIQTRFVYTGNDIVPFDFFIVNSEFGSGSTFSSIVMDKGVFTKGGRGYLVTSQTGSQRIDIEIPDTVFEVNLTNNGPERICAQRDYISEWLYWTYPSNLLTSTFPNATLQYNYRDDSWAIFYECYTTYGLFRRQTGFTWLTVGQIYKSWNEWNEPWNAGTSTLLNPQVIGGNQQGFVIQKDDGTSESQSLAIQNISGSNITCPNHCLNQNDYILINGALGTVGAQVNGKIFSITPSDANTFSINPSISSGTYLGGGLIQRIYNPNIQTKQFPVAWAMSRKVRIGAQQYLLTTTPAGQIEVQIFLSQNDDFPYNIGSIVPNIPPNPAPINNALIYSTLLYTCPESTNLGLTPANINLNMPTAINQKQTWHRMNTSLIGDTIQLGFTMSDAQLRSFIPSAEPFTITAISQSYPCVITTSNYLAVGQMISISGVQGMTQINYNGIQNTIYQVTVVSSTQISINLDSTAFSPYTMGGTITVMQMPNQFEEIELHGFILDVSPSQLLA